MAPTRRRFLQSSTLVTASGLTGLSGCTGSTDGDTPTDTTTITQSPTSSPSPEGSDVTVSVDTHERFGDILTDGEGRTLYLLTADPEGESVCTGDCAEAWPPLTVESPGAIEAEPAVEASLGTVERDDGSLQVAADGTPLYYFVNDENPGDATGQEVNNVWFVLRPDASPVKPTVSARSVDPLGTVMTDADGRSLYILTADPEGESVCTGDCADAWPPLTVESETALRESVRADGSLGTIERADGTLQVTADGRPLYYFANDAEPGDVTGQEVNNVWFVLRPDATVLKPTVSVREHEELGPILTDADGMTLYMFTQDEGTASNCTGDCADAWPPLTVGGSDSLVPSVRADVTLGTTEHPEAGPMATAAGRPLYYFANDAEPGDAKGQGLNDAWYVLDPTGEPVGN